MNHIAPKAFATLGHPSRLAAFRLLMRFAPRPMRPTEMAEALGLKPNTLSHHLADLTDCGLIQVERQGRSLLYSADLAATEALMDYLFVHVGRGRADLVPAGLTQPGLTPHDQIFHVLFICSGNSARSIFAEALLRDLGKGRFVAHSAGTRPNTQLNPKALDVLQRNGHSLEGLWSKHISTYQQPDAPEMDFVFTVCDAAASEECPPWPGQPITGHWGLPDPAKATGSPSDIALSFAQTYGALHRRIAAFVELPIASLSRLSLQTRVDQIDAEALSQENR